MSPGKIAVAATAFACTTLLTFTWSEQRGASLSIEKAQAIENTKAVETTKARTDRRPASVRAARVSHRNDRRAERRYGPGPNPVAFGAGVAAGAVDTAAGIAGAVTSPWVYPGGGPYAAEGWNGTGYASSPWGDYECRGPHAYECRPYASKEWK
jgi:hypothetical protein